MDYCLENASYPIPAMAFGGALALQSFLYSRKVREPGDLRTNLYLLALVVVFLGLLANLSTLAEIQRWAEIHFPQLRQFLRSSD